MRPPRFGIAFSSARRTLARIIPMAQQADQAGLDFISFQDHLYNPRWVDSWTLMTAVGVQTERIRLQIATATLPLRYPPVLAKQAMTLDILTGGRLELGIGSGGPQYADGIRSLGIEPPAGGRAVQFTEEAIAVFRELWEPGLPIAGEPDDQLERIQVNYDDYRLPDKWPTASFAGTQLQLNDAFRGPAPAHRIPLQVGATRLRLAELAGRKGDGWIVSYGRLSHDELLAMHARVDAGALSAGRDPATIDRQYNLFGTIGLGPSHLGPRTALTGPVDAWVEELVRCCTEDRMTMINYWPGDDPQQLAVYAAEVVPAVRNRLASASTPRDLGH